MSPNGNEDESGHPNSSTASPSKVGNEEGRWHPLTLERLPALTAVFASWSLVVSVAYDWGFLSACRHQFCTRADHPVGSPQ